MSKLYSTRCFYSNAKFQFIPCVLVRSIWLISECELSRTCESSDNCIITSSLLLRLYFNMCPTLFTLKALTSFLFSVLVLRTESIDIFVFYFNSLQRLRSRCIIFMIHVTNRQFMCYLLTFAYIIFFQ